MAEPVSFDDVVSYTDCSSCSSLPDLTQVIRDLEDVEGTRIMHLEMPLAEERRIYWQLESKVQNDNSGLIRCPVCVDGVAGDHVYYGGRACHSCRVFFRRAVRAGLDRKGTLRCSAGKGRNSGGGPWCEIRSKNRRGCRACRLDRCLVLAGLDSSQVSRNGREKGGAATPQQIVGSTMNKVIKTEISPMPSPPSSSSSLFVFGQDERLFFLRRFDVFLYCNHDKYFDFFSVYPGELSPFVASVTRGLPFRASMHASMCRMDQMSTINFCFDSVPEMSELSPFDRMALVNANGGAAFALEEAWFLSPRNIAFYVRHFLDYGRLCKSGHPVLGMLLSSPLSAVTEEGSRSRWGVDTVYLDSKLKTEHEDSWKELDKALAQVNANSPYDASDNVINVILFHIILFSTDAVDQVFENKERIVSIQRRYLGVLERYLGSIAPVFPLGEEKEERVSRALHAVQAARRFYRMHKERVEAAEVQQQHQQQYGPFTELSQ